MSPSIQSWWDAGALRMGVSGKATGSGPEEEGPPSLGGSRGRVEESLLAEVEGEGRKR